MMEIMEKTGNDVSDSTGLRKARPIKAKSPLLDIGNLPGGEILTQKGNSCGTCSLSAVLRHFRIDRTQTEIDRKVRNFNIFTAPDSIIRYARLVGLSATYRNNGSFEEIRELIEKGIPSILLIQTKPESRLNFLHLHYVVAISARESEEGNWLGIYNPWGLREEISSNELENAWANVRIGPFLCWNRAYIAITQEENILNKPLYERTRGVNMLGLSIASFVNGLAKLLRGEMKGILELLESLPTFIAGIAIFAGETLLRRFGSR
ncbi:MAG: hypothetical protein PHP64_03915 [Actinomycetota bacterium]|nr:hypothetical protein [Actinomycetota bacterium]